MTTYLMKMMATYLMKLCLIEYVLDEENMMYLQYVQKEMKKRIQNVLKSMMKRACLYEYADISRGSRICTRERT